METRIMQFIVQQLAATGFVLIDSSIAFESRPDLFGFNRANAGYAFNVPRTAILQYLRSLSRVNVIECQLDEQPEHLLLAFRATNPPIEHVEMVLGHRVTVIREIADEKPQP